MHGTQFFHDVNEMLLRLYIMAGGSIFFCLNFNLMEVVCEMKTNTKTFRLVFSALMIAISIVLSIFKFEFPFGGSITIFSMVPLVLVSQMYGLGWGMLTCSVYGLVQMALGLDNFGYVSGIVAYAVVFLFDYVLAFSMMGLSALTRKMNNRAVAAGLGAFIGCTARFVCHFISGCTVWGEYAAYWETPSFVSSALLKPSILPYTYSFFYNCLYMIPETILTVVGSAIICTILFEALKIDVNEPVKAAEKKAKNAEA